MPRQALSAVARAMAITTSAFTGQASQAADKAASGDRVCVQVAFSTIAAHCSAGPSAWTAPPLWSGRLTGRRSPRSALCLQSQGTWVRGQRLSTADTGMVPGLHLVTCAAGQAGRQAGMLGEVRGLRPVALQPAQTGFQAEEQLKVCISSSKALTWAGWRARVCHSQNGQWDLGFRGGGSTEKHKFDWCSEAQGQSQTGSLGHCKTQASLVLPCSRQLV